MPYTTNVAGTTITASWGNANVRDQVVTPFATTGARDSAITSPVNGMLSPITGSNIITYYNGTSWLCITPQSATVATNETTASATFVDLTTPGPAVTMNTGTKALVTVATRGDDSGGASNALMGYAISGATTLAAADTTAYIVGGVAGVQVQAGYTALVTGLTAGSNVFTAKYRASGGTASFANRTITVVGIP